MAGVTAVATQGNKLERVTAGERHITIGTLTKSPRRYWLLGQEIFIWGVSESGMHADIKDQILVFETKKPEELQLVPSRQYRAALVRRKKQEEFETYPEPTEFALGLTPVEIYPDRIIFFSTGKKNLTRCYDGNRKIKRECSSEHSLFIARGGFL